MGSFEYLVPIIVNGLELRNIVVAFNSFSCSLSMLFLSCPPNYGMIYIIVSLSILSLNIKFIGCDWWTSMGPSELSFVYLVSFLNIIESLLRILLVIDRAHKFNCLSPKAILSTIAYGSLKNVYK